MSSIFENTTTTSAAPWGPLQAPLMAGVGAMQSAFGNGVYGGPYTAPIDPLQMQGIQQGAGVAGTFTNQGNMLLPGLGDAYGFYSDILNNPNSTYLNQMVQSQMLNPYRNVVENVLPQNQLNAAMLGQSGGSGKDVTAAIADRGLLDREAMVRGNLMQNAAMNLQGLGGQGLGFLNQGAQGLYDWGTLGQNLQNQQIEGDMRQFYAPWEIVENYGNFINPLATGLASQTVTQDLLPGYLQQAAGPLVDVGGGILGDVLQGAWDWGSGALGGALGNAWDWGSGVVGNFFEDLYLNL